MATLLEAVTALEPTAIIGVAAVGGAFTGGYRAQDGCAQHAADRVRAVESHVEIGVHGGAGVSVVRRPAHSSRAARRSIRSAWAADVFVPRQCNNSYIFPGMGLGVIACRATRVTESMFMAAARTLADQVTPADLAQGSLFPPLKDVRDVSAQIAAAVVGIAFREGWRACRSRAIRSRS